MKKRKLTQIIGMLFLTLCLAVGELGSVAQAADSGNLINLTDWPSAPDIEADAAALIDARTGNILYGKNMHVQYYPASITKVLTALIACEEADMSDIVTYSHNAIYSIPWDGSTVGFNEGEKVSMIDSLYGMMLASGNEASVGIAEHIAGSSEAFAEMMNERAAAAGAKNSHFVTANGLHHEEHYTTAYDMARIFREAIHNDLFLQIASTYSYKIPPTNKKAEGYKVTAGHRMLNTRSEYYYPQAIAGKTGYTSKAGNTLVTYAKNGDTELICVILHAHQTQYVDTKALLEYGFRSYACYNAAKEDQTYGKEEIGFFSFLSPEFQRIPISVEMEDCYLLVPATVEFTDITSSVEFVKDETNPNLLAYVHYTYQGIEVGTGKLMAKVDESLLVSDPEPEEGTLETLPAETESEEQKEEKKVVLLNIWHILGWICLVVFLCFLALAALVYFSPKQRRLRRRKRLHRTYGTRKSGFKKGGRSHRSR